MDALQGGDGAAVAADQAAGRLERARRAALDRMIAQRRRQLAAQVALSLAETLCDEDPEVLDVRRPA